MRLIILCSSLEGTASHHLPHLAGHEGIEATRVVYSRSEIKNKKRFYIRKFKKLLKIGIGGMRNGVRMRKWYGDDVKGYTSIENLKDLCDRYGIELIEVPMINSPECIQAFTDFAPTLGLSLGNGYIGSKIFTIPTHGMLNIHHEILPEFQNAQSVIWQLYHGSKESGYTIHRIDKHIDTGAIVHQERIPIAFEADLASTVSKTVAQLYDASAKGLLRVIDDLDAKLASAKSQGNGGHYTTPTVKEMQQIQANFDRLRTTSQ